MNDLNRKNGLGTPRVGLPRKHSVRKYSSSRPLALSFAKTPSVSEINNLPDFLNADFCYEFELCSLPCGLLGRRYSGIVRAMPRVWNAMRLAI